MRVREYSCARASEAVARVANSSEGSCQILSSSVMLTELEEISRDEVLDVGVIRSRGPGVPVNMTTRRTSGLEYRSVPTSLPSSFQTRTVQGKKGPMRFLHIDTTLGNASRGLVLGNAPGQIKHSNVTAAPKRVHSWVYARFQFEARKQQCELSRPLQTTAEPRKVGAQ